MKHDGLASLRHRTHVIDVFGGVKEIAIFVHDQDSLFYGEGAERRHGMGQAGSRRHCRTGEKQKPHQAVENIERGGSWGIVTHAPAIGAHAAHGLCAEKVDALRHCDANRGEIVVVAKSKNFCRLTIDQNALFSSVLTRQEGEQSCIETVNRWIRFTFHIHVH